MLKSFAEVNYSQFQDLKTRYVGEGTNTWNNDGRSKI